MAYPSTSSSSEPLVVRPADLAESEAAALVGGKGAELCRLKRLGFDVPPFFCVTTRAFDLFLERARVRGRVEEAFAGVHPEDFRFIEERAKDLREAVLAAPVPLEVVEAVRGARGDLGRGKSVCVRSSGVAEDTEGASFAGQYDTILNVKGEKALFEALVACWASAFHPWAVQYRLRSESGAAGFAVVVQEMVRAECAGVAFTIHPVTGSPDEIVIEACFGLGEALVSGRLAPDRYAVPKGSAGRVRVEIAEKDEVWVPAREGKGGIEKERLGAEDRLRRVLTDEEALDLAALAERVERAYGNPRDIEWARAGGRFTLLQCRPVTARGGEAPEGWVPELDTPIPVRFPTYSNGNISEVLPGIVSPLSWSLAGPSLEFAFRRPCVEMGLVDEAREMPEEWLILGFFYHRPYLNISFFRALADRTPGLTREAVDEEFMGKRQEGRSVVDRSILDPRNWPKLARMLAAVREKPARIEKDVAAARRRIAEERRRLEREPPGGQSLEELLAEVQPTREGFDFLATHIWASEFAVVNFDLLRKLTRRFLRDEGGMLASRLVTGLAEVESAKPSLEMWRLSRTIARSRGLTALFERFGAKEVYFELARAPEGSEEAGFFWELEAFLDAYGHRGILEAELMNPTWREDPSYVLGIIRTYAGASPERDPSTIAERQAAERERAEAEARARLEPWLRPVFARVVRAARKYIARREEVKALLIEAGSLVRPRLRELARKMTKAGYLASRKDIFFLTVGDLAKVARGDSSRDETARIVRNRRRDFELCRGVRLPNLIEGKAVPIRGEEPRARPGAERLAGLGVSPGRVTGRARVILDPRSDATIEPGEILVAPVTDAGWAPIFLLASALVVDIGGMLSHGSIVAREYGIPAVVNVKTGTRSIRTGDLITVDGGTGEVLLVHGCRLS